MRGYRPSYFYKADISQADLLQEDRARRVLHYAQRIAKGERLFKELKSVIRNSAQSARSDGRTRPTPLCSPGAPQMAAPAVSVSDILTAITTTIMPDGGENNTVIENHCQLTVKCSK